MSPIFDRVQNKKGVAFIASLLSATFVITLSAAMIGFAAAEYQLTVKAHRSAIAFNLAEAGIERCLWELNYGNGTWSGWSSTAGTETGVPLTDADYNKTYLQYSRTFSSFGDSAGNIMGEFVVTLKTYTGTSAVIDSIGYEPSVSSYRSRRMARVRATKAGVFGNGIRSIGNVALSGNAGTDSYDSSLGTYVSQTPGHEGDVSANGNITASGNAYVDGHTIAGPGMSVPAPSFSYHTPTISPVPITLTPIPSALFTSAAATNNNASIAATYLSGTSLSVSGNGTATLAAGTYYFTSVSISGNGRVNVTGEAIVYLNLGSGSASFSGNGFVNSTPSNLTIYGQGSSGGRIQISGNGSFTGSIYAPTLDVNISGNGDLYGMIGAQNITDSGNGTIHYDVNLRNKTAPFGNYSTHYWQEKQP